MNNKTIKIILQQVLDRSPHRALDRFHKIYCIKPIKMEKVTDQAYLNKNLSQIYCDYLLTNQFKTIKNKPSIFFDNAIKFQNYLIQVQKRQHIGLQQMEEKLISISQKLQQCKNSHYVYSQAQDLISSLSVEQAYVQKNYLMYIYQWSLNQKGRLIPSSQKLAQQLKITIVKKLSQAYANTQQNRQIENEINRLQILAKARQSKFKGYFEQAKLYYELVYKNMINNQTVRIQALQFLCQNSEKNSDENYLKNFVINIIEQSGQYKHMKYIQRSLSQIHQNQLLSNINLFQLSQQ